MTLGDRLVNSVLIVCTVSREGRQGTGELVEQRGSSCGIVALFLGQLDGDDFAALAIEADMPPVATSKCTSCGRVKMYHLAG
jgi:hypothetical protein